MRASRVPTTSCACLAVTVSALPHRCRSSPAASSERSSSSPRSVISTNRSQCRPLAASQLDQALPQPLVYGFRTARRIELAEHRLEMELDGVLRNAEPARRLLVA